MNWGYDYSDKYNKKVITSLGPNNQPAEYGVAKYGAKEDFDIAEPTYVPFEYTTGIDIQTPKTNGTGSGSVVTVGIETVINGAPYSIQKIDIHALMGRLL